MLQRTRYLHCLRIVACSVCSRNLDRITGPSSPDMAKDASTPSDEYYAKGSTPSQTSIPRHTNPLTNSALPNTTSKTATGLHSEHGHSLTRIQPMAKHSGESVATFFNGLFTTIIGIATLGASITFSYVLQQPSSNPPPHTHDFTQHTILLFLGISWLLFLLALAFASSFSTLLTFFKSHWKQDWDGLHGKKSQVAVQWYAVIASATMGGLVVGAFVCLCLVVIGYQPVIGWIALGFTSVFGLLITCSVLYQCPWAWRDVKPLKTLPKKAVTV